MTAPPRDERLRERRASIREIMYEWESSRKKMLSAYAAHINDLNATDAVLALFAEAEGADRVSPKVFPEWLRDCDITLVLDHRPTGLWAAQRASGLEVTQERTAGSVNGRLAREVLRKMGDGLAARAAAPTRP